MIRRSVGRVNGGGGAGDEEGAEEGGVQVQAKKSQDDACRLTCKVSSGANDTLQNRESVVGSDNFNVKSLKLYELD